MFGEIRIHWYFCLLYFSDTEGTHHPLKSNLLKEKIVSFKVQEKVNYTFCNRIKLYFNDMNQKKKIWKSTYYVVMGNQAPKFEGKDRFVTTSLPQT